MQRKKHIRFLCTFWGLALLLTGLSVQAGGFSAAVSPPRFELKAESGQVVRQVLEIYNMSNADEQYDIRSNDWSLQGDNLTFSEALTPGSCRPWVRLERRKVTVRRADKRGFRFEIHVPPGTPAQECRFALLVEGLNPAANRVGGNLNLPANGRLAVIVYLAVGDAAPKLNIQTIRLAGGKAVLQISNQGLAHGRLQGTLAGTDARGQALDFSVSSMPVMPGETRLLELTPHLNGKRHSGALNAPLHLKGRLYWNDGAFAIDKRV
ncbi:MAG TPA: hypothetical protein PLB10_01520 [Thiolinea sp.]|nr:hypothetical protein [Thiolinea sp.]